MQLLIAPYFLASGHRCAMVTDDTVTPRDVPRDGHGTVTSSENGCTTVCSVCGRRFSRPDHLKRHVTQMHAPTKAHSCQDCGASFARRCEALVVRDKSEQLMSVPAMLSVATRASIQPARHLCRIAVSGFCVARVFLVVRHGSNATAVLLATAASPRK